LKYTRFFSPAKKILIDPKLITDIVVYVNDRDMGLFMPSAVT